MKKALCVLMTLIIMIPCILSLTVTASAYDDLHFSQEYRSSAYYSKLMQALEASKEKTVMERTLAVALSQEGYLNYSVEGMDINQAKADGKLWTGAELRMNSNDTGNTEYTRWAQRYIMGTGENAQYADYDWCAIFVSWCLYQAGYYSRDELKKYYYSYCADPRIFYDADSWIESFNFDQHGVYYVPKAHHKLDAMDWNTYYHVDIDPYDIPYKPGGIVFFSWDASGDYFNHVAIVVGYDTETHVLTYTNGNSAGMVVTRQIDLDVTEEFRGTPYAKNAERIMGYVDYDEIKPLEEKEITTPTPVITWDKSASSGIKIRTNSESVTASVYLDDVYYGSIIESNMIFHEGLLSIGASELRRMERGMHQLTLAFEDGSIDLALKITNTKNEPMGRIGDVDLDKEVTVIDATAIQRFLAGIDALNRIQQLLADTDGDGEVTILDATMIQRRLASLPASDTIETLI